MGPPWITPQNVKSDGSVENNSRKWQRRRRRNTQQLLQQIPVLGQTPRIFCKFLQNCSKSTPRSICLVMLATGRHILGQTLAELGQNLLQIWLFRANFGQLWSGFGHLWPFRAKGGQIWSRFGQTLPGMAPNFGRSWRPARDNYSTRAPRSTLRVILEYVRAFGSFFGASVQVPARWRCFSSAFRVFGRRLRRPPREDLSANFGRLHKTVHPCAELPEGAALGRCVELKSTLSGHVLWRARPTSPEHLEAGRDSVEVAGSSAEEIERHRPELFVELRAATRNLGRPRATLPKCRLRRASVGVSLGQSSPSSGQVMRRFRALLAGSVSILAHLRTGVGRFRAPIGRLLVFCAPPPYGVASVLSKLDVQGGAFRSWRCPGRGVRPVFLMLCLCCFVCCLFVCCFVCFCFCLFFVCVFSLFVSFSYYRVLFVCLLFCWGVEVAKWALRLGFG